jgi:CRP-like cAMP-binding protein
VERPNLRLPLIPGPLQNLKFSCMELLLDYLDSIHPLSPELRDYLSEKLMTREYLKKDFLLNAGRVCNHIYFIEKGLFRCFYTREDEDREVSAWFMKEGDVIASVDSFFNQTPSYENIQALEDSVVHFISWRELDFIYERFPEFNFIGRKLVEKYYVLSEQRIYSLRMKRSFDRYYWLMKNYPELIQRVPSKFIASYIGNSSETVSRIRGRR